jgi:hypothetical protein
MALSASQIPAAHLPQSPPAPAPGTWVPAGDDPLAPARGILLGLLLGASLWAGGLWALVRVL